MIQYLEHHIVDHCNLACGGCSHFSPLANEWFEDIEEFTRDFTRLAEITNKQVGIIRLMGGEPLLHPDYPKFLEITRTLFPYSNIQIVTNGLLLKKEQQRLAAVCNDYNIQVCVSDYGLGLNLHELLSDVALTRIDGKTSLYNICLDLEGNQDPQQAFDHCDLHMYKWFYFQGGRFYPCCVGANINFFNWKFKTDLPHKKEELSISIHEHTEEEILEFLNKPIPLCRFCDTIQRPRTYHRFAKSTGDISEWIYP